MGTAPQTDRYGRIPGAVDQGTGIADGDSLITSHEFQTYGETAVRCFRVLDDLHGKTTAVEASFAFCVPALADRSMLRIHDHVKFGRALNDRFHRRHRFSRGVVTCRVADRRGRGRGRRRPTTRKHDRDQKQPAHCRFRPNGPPPDGYGDFSPRRKSS